MHRFSGRALSEQFKKGEISATAIAQKCLKRAEAFEPKLQAFLNILSERMLKKAEALDKKRAEGKPLGKLAGIPIAIKDNMHIKGEISTCGSRFLSNYRAPFDATVIRLMEDEDALLVGKTNMDEFAMGSSTENSAYKPTHNPWDLTCSPGGSSGGSAAAVAARICPMALGSDTGGSVRQPAAFCGIVGFKPTYGRVSRYGLVAYASSLDQISPFSTTVTDSALLMHVIGRHCEHDSTSLDLPPLSFLEMATTSMKSAKIGVPWSFLETLSPEVRKNFEESLERFKGMGMEIVDVDLDILKYSLAVYYVLANAEASANLARFDGIRFGNRSLRATTLDEVYDFSKQEGFGAEVKRRILLGTFVLSSGYQDAYYKKAQKVRALIIEKFKTAFAQCRMIALPTSPFPAFPTGSIQDPLQMYLQDIYTICVNLAGLPAISLPSGLNSEGKPLSLQLIGPQKQDSDVLLFAHAFEKLCPPIIPPAFDMEVS